MKKLIINFFSLIILFFIGLIILLSTKGYETDKFNKLISIKASQTKNINLELDTIRFKINPKDLSLFLETQNPKISFKEILIPVKNIKVYIDFFSLLKSDIKIKKASFLLEELDITQLNKLSLIIKPSNFKSLLNNKVKKGKVISEIEIFLTEEGKFKDFIAKGTVKDLKVELLSNLNFTKLNLDFFADRNDILIKNIVGDLEDLKISNGDIKLNLENGIKLNSNFNSLFNLDERLAKKYHKLFSKYKFTKNIKNLKANLNNTVSIDFDKTYKIKDYNYIISGVVEHGKFESSKPIKNNLISQEIKEIYFSDFKISTIFRPEKNNFKGNGKYSLNNQDFLSLNLENNYSNNINYLKLDCDFSNNLNLDFINYKKDNNKISSLSLDLEKKEKKIKINQLEYNNDKDSIKVNGLVFEENKFLALKKMEISTAKNDFSIQMSRNIIIKGNKFDATNLAKFFNNKNNSDKNRFKTINKKIEIDFKNIQVPLSEKLQNFKLLGVIKKGRFVKISSKGDFGGGNFIDITLKKDKNSEVKYLEIYSDLTRPLLTEYSFFQGLTGGKLLFTSIIDNTKSNSKLKIENFKLINAPGVIKLLSLADLSGLADLAEGEGLSFDLLEIDMETNKGFLKLNEILALGPSISVIMEGYQEKNGLTSLRGTLVPAKTLNKMISKIPIIGKIVIPKEVGEGLFGISFKMKGPKGDIKTSINPIKTLTPRFIQKIIEKGKESK